MHRAQSAPFHIHNTKQHEQHGLTDCRAFVLLTWPFLIIVNACTTATSAIFVKTGSQSAGIAAVPSPLYIAFVWLYSGVDNFVTGIFYSYPSEVLSFSLRAKGMVVWNTVNQATGLYNASANSVASGAIGWKYYTVFLALLFVWYGLLWYFIVETNGLTLGEIDILFKARIPPLPLSTLASRTGLAHEGVAVARTSLASEDKDKKSI
ncbi:hypothetical protein JCM8547_002226 [Rhodosporidiobolus lusitaniae]